MRLNEQLIDHLMLPLGLSRTQWKIIARFTLLPIPCTQQQLLTSMEIDRAHLARALSQLESRGLLRRERIAEDRRALHIFPTDAGLGVLQKIEEILQAESRSLTQGFNEEDVQTLHQAIERIQANIASQLEKKG